jgi:hypothetical protein
VRSIDGARAWSPGPVMRSLAGALRERWLGAPASVRVSRRA